MIPETLTEWNSLMKYQTELGCETQYKNPDIGMKMTVHASFPSNIDLLKKEEDRWNATEAYFKKLTKETPDVLYMPQGVLDVMDSFDL